MKNVFGKKGAKKFLAALAAALIFAGVSTDHSVYAYNKLNEDMMVNIELAKEMADAPYVSAGAAIVIDADDGRVLYEKNADSRMYPASMTKIMTCIIALEQGEPASIVTVSDYAADVECTRLISGNQIRLYDLLRQMMLVSDNGAATAIGEHIAGSEANFAQMMNDKAEALGMTGTHFVNMNGMPDENHYSTARDMAILAQYCMQNENFRQIVGTKGYRVPYVTPEQRSEYCENTNELLYDYPGTVGIKTGYTRAAGGCLASAIDRDGHELIAIVMHSDDDDTRFSDSKQLFEYSLGKY